MANPTELCEVCGTGPLVRRVLEGGASVLQCLSCGFGRSAGGGPRSRPLEGIYSSEEVRSRWKLKEEARQRIWMGLLSPWISEGKSGRHLDVGAGAGGFIRLTTSHGWTPVGMEREPSLALELVRSGQEAVLASMSDLPFQDEVFQLVSFMDSLEHFADPLGALAEARRVLSEAGHLIVTCPNATSFCAQRFRGLWPWWTPGDHLCHFSPRSLGILLERSGFEIVHLVTREELGIHEDIVIRVWSLACWRMGLAPRLDFSLRPLSRGAVRLTQALLRPLIRREEKRLRGAWLVTVSRRKG